MHSNDKWMNLQWRHSLWDLVRYYRSLHGKTHIKEFLKELRENKSVSIEKKPFPISNDTINLLFEYLDEQEMAFKTAVESLRSEEEAKGFCFIKDFNVGKTATQNDSYQSSKAIIAAVSGISKIVCSKLSISSNVNPQNRCVWFDENNLHVTSRNLDGAIPGLVNPIVIWEIKEYWGKTKGGSKMSDAVYECQLVGRELREFEENFNKSIIHCFS
jgi:hypothetical protein